MISSRKWDIRFLKLAQHVSAWSKDPSTKTGAVITVGKQVISVGYNGFPVGMPDDETLYDNREEKYSRVVHCEVNALIYAGKLDPHAQHTLYTTPFPSCDRCVVQMIQAGIRTFVAPEPTQEAKDRWGAAFERTYRYIHECNGHIELIPVSELHGS